MSFYYRYLKGRSKFIELSEKVSNLGFYSKSYHEKKYLRNENHDNEYIEESLFKQSNIGVNFNKYENLKVEVIGKNPPPPIENYSDLKIHDIILSNIKLCNYTKPTPVQKYAIPILLSKNDLLASAQTGSGKTAAFLIPIINGLLEIQFNDKHFRDPKAIILAPTRELAQQIYKECLKFTYKTGLKPICVYGGVSIDFKYRSDIKRGCDILIATPGRLIDILKRSLISLSQIKYFCLDEADRLLDRGFEPQIRDIVETSDMPSSGERVSMFFSASYPDEVLKMANDFMRDYYFLKVGKVGSTTENITQVILWAERYEKDKLLIEELKKNIDRVLIFVERKIQVDELKGKLKKNGFKATGIHGGIPQPKRELSLRRFRSGKYPIMVATSIAARGLDIENVSHVINYDLPSNIDEYIHRIGRTGRAGKDGLAISFFNESNNNVAIDLIEVLEQTGQEVPQWLYEYRTWRQNSNKRNYSSESKYFDDFDGIVGAEDEWDNYFF